MSLFLFSNSVKRDPEVERWLDERTDELGDIAARWFGLMRDCGDDVRELLHDGHPTACVLDAAFGYVDVFTSHVNVGFYRGSELEDPRGMLLGSGRLMRHVKLTPETPIDDQSLTALIQTAYADMRARVA